MCFPEGLPRWDASPRGVRIGLLPPRPRRTTLLLQVSPQEGPPTYRGTRQKRTREGEGSGVGHGVGFRLVVTGAPYQRGGGEHMAKPWIPTFSSMRYAYLIEGPVKFHI